MKLTLKDLQQQQEEEELKAAKYFCGHCDSEEFFVVILISKEQQELLIRCANRSCDGYKIEAESDENLGLWGAFDITGQVEYNDEDFIENTDKDLEDN